MRGGAAGGLEHGAAGRASAQQPQGDHRSPVRRARHLARSCTTAAARGAGVDVRTRLGGVARARRHAAATRFLARAHAGLRPYLRIDGRARRLRQERRPAARRGGAAGAPVGPRARHPACWPPCRRTTSTACSSGCWSRSWAAAAWCARRRCTPRRSPAQAGAWQANVLVSVPAHLHALATLRPAPCPPLRRIFSSGAALDAATGSAVAKLAGIPVTEVLGSSETGGIAWRESGGGRRRLAAVPRRRGRPRRRRDDAPSLPVPGPLDGDAQGWYRGADRIRARRRRPLRAARAAPTAWSKSAAAAWRSRRSNACCARSPASPTPRWSPSTRRRRGGTSCGRPWSAPGALGRGAARRPAQARRADRGAPPLPARRRPAPRGQRQAGPCPSARAV